MSGKSVDEIWQAIRDAMTYEMTKHVPTRNQKNRKGPPWLNAATKRAVDRKRVAWQKWRRTGREEDEEYRRWEASAKKMVRKRKNGWERDVANHRKKNPKFFFSQINRDEKRKRTINWRNREHYHGPQRTSPSPQPSIRIRIYKKP